MKNTILFLILIASILTNYSCTKSVPSIPDNLIIGTWVLPSDQNYNDYKRESELDESRPGFIFQEDGKITQRANCGFCGTPPISYCDFVGTWEEVDDTHITFTLEYWDGYTSRNGEILSIDENYMTLIITNQ